MKKGILIMLLALLAASGCSSHTPDPNARMMDTVIGELDRETAK